VALRFRDRNINSFCLIIPNYVKFLIDEWLILYVNMLREFHLQFAW